MVTLGSSCCIPTLPASPGVYAWYFDVLPGAVPANPTEAKTIINKAIQGMGFESPGATVQLFGFQLADLVGQRFQLALLLVAELALRRAGGGRGGRNGRHGLRGGSLGSRLWPLPLPVRVPAHVLAPAAVTAAAAIAVAPASIAVAAPGARVLAGGGRLALTDFAPSANGPGYGAELVFTRGATLASNAELRSLARPALLVPDTWPLGELIGKLQTSRSHVAVVIDPQAGPRDNACVGSRGNRTTNTVPCACDAAGACAPSSATSRTWTASTARSPRS